MPKDTALVVIDVQNIMFETEGYTPYQGKRVLEAIKGLIGRARETETPVVYIQHTTDDDGSPFEKGSRNWLVHPDIAPQDGDVTSLKRSYDAFFNTRLNDKLQRLGARKLVLCGMQTEICVDSTVRAALTHGYQSVIVSDGHTTFDKDVAPANVIVDLHNDVWHNRFGQVMPARDVEF